MTAGTAGRRRNPPSPTISRSRSWKSLTRSDRTVLVSIAVFLAIVVLFALFLNGFFFPPGTTTTGPVYLPVGSAFGAGNPLDVNCTVSLVLSKARVTAGDFTYELTLTGWGVPFGSVRFEIANSTGTVLTNSGVGEFAVVNATDVPLTFSVIGAGRGLAMTQDWTTYSPGISDSNSTARWESILVDTGQIRPISPVGFEFIANGVGYYTGDAITPLS